MVFVARVKVVTERIHVRSRRLYNACVHSYFGTACIRLCVSHIETLVQVRVSPEGLCVIHKTLVIGNPKTSIPGIEDRRIQDNKGYQGDQ